MANCLKKQLKESVQNSSLNTLGCLRIHFTQSQATNHNFTATFGTAMGNKTVKVFNEAGTLLKTTTLNGSGGLDNSSMQDVSVAGYIDVSDKYSVRSLILEPYTNSQLDLSTLKLCPLVGYVVILNPSRGSLEDLPNTILSLQLDTSTNNGTGKITGNLATVNSWASLKYLTIYGTSIKGDLADLLGKTSLDILNIRDRNISGDINDFFDAQYAMGKQSGSTIIRAYTTLTYNGADYTGEKKAVFSENGWTLEY